MTNLTLSIEDKLLQAARVRAVKEGTSVNEICRKALEAYVRPPGQGRLARYLEVQAAIDAATPPQPAAADRGQGREALYDEMLAERHPTLLGGRKKKVR